MNHNHDHTQDKSCSHGCCDEKDVTAHGCCGGKDAHHHTTSEASSFTCPMHPNVKDNKPGRCPECGMNLVPVKKTND